MGRRQPLAECPANGVPSHPHGDHAGGTAPVLRASGVTQFADSGQQYSGHAYGDAVATARTDRVPIVYPRAGMVWRTEDGVTLTFIGPSLPSIWNTSNKKFSGLLGQAPTCVNVDE